MKQPLKIPPLGESVSEATISRVIKKSGSYVNVDDEIVELETEKVNQVLFAPTSGLLDLSVKEGDSVKVGAEIGSIDSSQQRPQEAKPQETKSQETTSQEAKPQEAKPPTPAPPQAMPSQATPDQAILGQTKSEKVMEKGESLRQKEDEWLKNPPKEEPKSEPAKSKVPQRIKMTRLRKTIAARLLEAKNSTAMLTTFNEVDMTACMEIRAKEQEAFMKKYGVKLGFMSLFVKATVSALKAFPEVNAYIDGDDIVRLSTYDIGIAVSTDKGLVVPVVRDCDQMNYGEIEQKIEQYAKAARSSQLKIEDLRGGSFTITNGGRFGSLLSTPLLNIPQSAILGMHSILKRPIAIENEIVIRPMMYLALSYDHRLIDGREAVLFLIHIKDHLESPTKLLLDV